MTRQQKATVLALALYWPTLFVLAHIPIPEVVRQADISDKSLHVLMYMILTFLLWSAFKPQSKLDWRRAAPWLTLAVVLGYAFCDEYLQRFVAGRSMDLRDLVADTGGALAALAVLSFCSFWAGLLVVTGMTIYTLAVFTRANLTELLPVTTTVFHLATYGFFALVWIACLRTTFGVKRSDRRWLVAAAIAPFGLLFVTKASALVSGKAFEGWDVAAAAVGSLAAIASCYVVDRTRGRVTHYVTVPNAEP